MARITFGQITLEDSNKSLQELVQIYKGLFVNDEFGLPLISTTNEEPELEEDYDDEYDESSDEEIEETNTEDTQEQPNPTQNTEQTNNY
jgi:hypothetical protein